MGVLLETSWGPLVLSCSRLGHIGAIFGRRGAFLDRLGGLLELSWPVLEPSGLRNSHARNPGSARKRPGAPRSARAGGVWAPKKLQSSTSRGCMSLGALHYVPRARWRILLLAANRATVPAQRRHVSKCVLDCSTKFSRRRSVFRGPRYQALPKDPRGPPGRSQTILSAMVLPSSPARARLNHLGVLWICLGAIVESCWGSLGPTWGVGLGLSWGPQEPCVVPLRPLVADEAEAQLCFFLNSKCICAFSVPPTPC